MDTEGARNLDQAISTLRDALDDARGEIAGLRRRLDETHRAMLRVRVLAMTGMAVVVAGLFVNLTEADGSGQSVRAPFTVVSASGQPILKVSDAGGAGHLLLYTLSGKLTAGFHVDDNDGGSLWVSNAAGTDVFNVNANNGSGELALWGKNGNPIADILEGPHGGRGLWVYNSKGEPVARVQARSDGGGQVSAGFKDKQTGFVATSEVASFQVMDPSGNLVTLQSSHGPADRRGFWVYDQNGHQMVSIKEVEDQHPAFYIYGSGFNPVAGFEFDGDYDTLLAGGSYDGEEPNVKAGGPFGFQLSRVTAESATPIAALTANSHGGYLNLGNNDGFGTVEAGTMADGRGVVLVYPQGGPTPIPIPHLIEGWKGPSK